jgi:hypothetical protein
VIGDVPRTYAALREALQAHGAGAGALAGLTELAGVLHGRLGLSPAAAARWLTSSHAALGDRRPLDVWLGGRADRVIDAARAEPARSA